jgi:hypothetical protein
MRGKKEEGMDMQRVILIVAYIGTADFKKGDRVFGLVYGSAVSTQGCRIARGKGTAEIISMRN